MHKTLILAAATLALGLAGQAQAGWNNGVSLNGIGTQNGTSSAALAEITIQGVTLPGGAVIHSIVMPD